MLIELGGNDLLSQTPRLETEQHLSAIISRIQATGAAVVLIAVDGPLGYGGLGKMMKRLSKTYQTAYVPNILRGLIGSRKDMADSIHPNAEGHKIIAERIAKVLTRKFPKQFHK